MSVTIQERVLAQLVANYHGTNIALFQVTDEYLSELDSGFWSEPCQFRFVSTEGGLVDLEVRNLEEQAT